MNEQRIEELKEVMRTLMESIIQRGQPLTDELRDMLLQVIEHVGQRIMELRTPSIPEKQPELQQAMPSSNIDAFAYDDKNGKMLVRFLGKYPNRQGPIYSYEGIPKVIFDLFRKGAIPARTDGKNKWGSWWKGKVPSIGASMYSLIKNGAYPYQKLS
jgi:hypothetical protein